MGGKASDVGDAGTNIDTANQPQVLTLVMTIEYNGFQYAGFQRQTATPARNITSGDESSTREPPTKKAKKNTPTRITVQHQIEMALVKWTNLSIATLRVRCAGRTDKGVHASGQVVAFDVPLKYLAELDSNQCTRENGDNNILHDHDAAAANDVNSEESLSKQSINYLQEAYHTLAAYQSSKTTVDDNDIDTNNTKTFIDQWEIRRAITTRFPPSADIVIRSVRIWTGTHPFEARKDIACKTYIYKLRFRSLAYLNKQMQTASNAQQQQNTEYAEKLQIHPICNAGPHLLRRVNDNNTVWLCSWPLDQALLREACRAFMGRHDFYNFVHKEERKKSNERDDHATNAEDSCGEAPKNKSSYHEIDLFQFKVDMQPENEYDTSLPPVIIATFTLKAKGFRRSMVRSLVGFVVDVARGLRSLDDIPVLLMKKDASCNVSDDKSSLATMVHSAPACGLSLAEVEYEHDLFL